MRQTGQTDSPDRDMRERLATAIVKARPHNGYIGSGWIARGWTAQPDYGVHRG